MRKTLGIMLAAAPVVAFVVGCGQATEASPKFCSAVEQMEEAMDGYSSSTTDLELLQTIAREADNAWQAMEAAAPEDITEALETMHSTESDTRKISEQEAYDEAQTKVNTFIRQECDLDITM